MVLLRVEHGNERFLKMSNPYQNSNGIFENKLGIQNVAELKLIEYDLTTQKSNT